MLSTFVSIIRSNFISFSEFIVVSFQKDDTDRGKSGKRKSGGPKSKKTKSGKIEYGTVLEGVPTDDKFMQQSPFGGTKSALRHNLLCHHGISNLKYKIDIYAFSCIDSISVLVFIKLLMLRIKILILICNIHDFSLYHIRFFKCTSWRDATGFSKATTRTIPGCHRKANWRTI